MLVVRTTFTVVIAACHLIMEGVAVDDSVPDVDDGLDHARGETNDQQEREQTHEPCVAGRSHAGQCADETHDAVPCRCAHALHRHQHRRRRHGL